MKAIFSVICLCLLITSAAAQVKPDKKLKVVPPPELRSYEADSLNRMDSIVVSIDPSQVHSKMPEYKADPGIDYKMKIVRPDSTVDYKILKKKYPSGKKDLR